MLFAVYVYDTYCADLCSNKKCESKTYLCVNELDCVDNSPIYSDFHPDGTKIFRGVFSDRASEKSDK